MKWCAISDIHGHYDALMELEKQVLEQHPNVCFIYGGDYIDRGPDSLKVLQHVQAQVAAGHIALKGNHELFLEEYLKGEFYEYSYTFGINTMKSLDPDFVPVTDFIGIIEHQLKMAQTHADLLVFLEGLPLIHEESNTVFIHGGFNPYRKHYSQSTEVELTCPSWNMPTHAGTFPEKHFIFGHVHVQDYHGNDNHEPLTRQNMTFIDGGAGSKKYLNAYLEDGTHLSISI